MVFVLDKQKHPLMPTTPTSGALLCEKAPRSPSAHAKAKWMGSTRNIVLLCKEETASNMLSRKRAWAGVALPCPTIRSACSSSCWESRGLRRRKF